MKEIINTVGTIAVIVTLVVAITLWQGESSLVPIIAGVGIIYTMYFHDEYLKTIWKNEWLEKAKRENDIYNEEIDRYNAEVDRENEEEE